MAGKKQSGQKDKGRTDKPQKGNLGQDEAQQQQEKETELRQMGDMTRQSEHRNKQQSD